MCTDAAIVAVGDKIYSFGGFNTDVAYPDLSSDTHLDVHIMQTGTILLWILNSEKH